MQRKPVIIGVAVLVGIAVPWLVWQAIKGPSWKDAADAAIESLFKGEPRAVLPYLHEEELVALQMSKADALKVLNEVVVPELRNVHLTNNNELPQQYGSKVVVKFDMLAGQRKVLGGLEVYDTPNGPRLLLSQLVGVCMQPILPARPKTDNPSWKPKVNAITSRLSSAGMPGIWHIDTGRIEKWRQY